MKRVLIFCSSSNEVAPIFFSEMQRLAQELTAAQMGVVYGGACVGLMGYLADETLKRGGLVTGVIPEYLNQPGIVHEGLSELVVVSNLLDRKRRMLEMADGVIAFPGGIGTLDEVTEALALKQLKEVNKPIVFLNLMDFWTPLLTYLDEMKQQKMVSQNFEELFQVFPSSQDVVSYLKQQM